MGRELCAEVDEGKWEVVILNASAILCMLEIFHNRIRFQKYTVKGSTDILEKFCEREDERKMAY